MLEIIIVTALLFGWIYATIVLLNREAERRIKKEEKEYWDRVDPDRYRVDTTPLEIDTDLCDCKADVIHGCCGKSHEPEEHKCCGKCSDCKCHKEDNE